jgi:DNA-binding response OmpR family regulator
VEDHQDLSDMAAMVLKTRGHVSVCALTAKSALESLENDLFNLIMLDLSLPGLDPEAFVQTLRSNLKWKNIPILLASGRSDLDQWARRLGVPKLAKPYDLSTLIETVEKVAGYPTSQ